MKSSVKKVLVLLLAIVLVIGAAACSATRNTTDSNKRAPAAASTSAFVNLGKEVVKDFITANESQYYNVAGIDFSDSEITYASDTISFETHASVTETLKAATVEDLPYVKGYLDVLGVSSYTNLTPAQKNSTVANEITFSRSNSLQSATVSKDVGVAVDTIDAKLADIQSYIGTPMTIGMDFKVSIDTANINNPTKDNISISAIDSLENVVSVDQYDLPTYNDMFSAGTNDLSALLDSVQLSVDRGNDLFQATASVNQGNNPYKTVALVPIDNWSIYNRIAARDYAYKWYGPSDSNYNPAYGNYNSSGGDCANFVSQCIYAGGVPQTTTWKPASGAWLSSSGLTNYMVSNGYAVKTAYTNTNAGNFAYTTVNTAGHIVLVSINDSVTVAYTAHNSNQKDKVFSSAELNGNYSFYVIKNY